MERQDGDGSLRRYFSRTWFDSYLIHVVILQHAALRCVASGCALCCYAFCFVVILRTCRRPFEVRDDDAFT